MNIGLIGELVENTMVIKQYADKCQHSMVCSGFVDNADIITQFVSVNSSCDIIIIDLTNLICLSDDDFRMAVNKLCSEFTGKIICFEPSQNGHKLAIIAAQCGVKYFVDEVFTPDIEKQLASFIENNKVVNEPEVNIPKFSNTANRVMNENNMINEPMAESNGRMITVGVIGIIPRIGVTTQCISIIKFLQTVGRRACYIEKDKTKFIYSLLKNYDGIKQNEYTDSIEYQGVEMFYQEDSTFKLDYDYRVIDYGTIDDGIPADFMSRDIKIVLLGTSPEELNAFSQYAEVLYELDCDLEEGKKILYVFSLVSPSEYNDALELMGTIRNRTYFSPYIPSAFDELNDDGKAFYSALLKIQLPLVEGKKGLKKKKRR